MLFREAKEERTFRSAGDAMVEARDLEKTYAAGGTTVHALRGFVFQTYNLIPVLSAVENVELPLLVAGVRSKEARGRALSVLRAVGLADQVNKRPNEMSGGQQQRVTVARSLVNEPAIVWADEPTGALDSETSAEIVELLVRLNREQGQTFVLVTHDISVARRARRLVRMRDGKIESDEPDVKEERDD